MKAIPIRKAIDHTLAQLTIGVIRIYQYTFSPDKGLFSFFLKGRICSHNPHCSEYGIRCLKRYGFWHGLPKVSDRILHCTPSMQKIYDPEHYRVVFFSSAEIWVPFLETLAEDNRFELVGIVTQEDKPVGRGLKLTPNIIKKTALNLNFQAEDVQTPNKINPDTSIEGKNFSDRLRAKNPDFLVVIAYGKLIPQGILTIPPFWAINVHGSLLPKYRGASPLQSVFLANETKTGITIMHMDAGMDTWAIIAKLARTIPLKWTVKELIETIKKNWPQFLNTTLRWYAKNEIPSKPQNEWEASYCTKITKQDGEITPLQDDCMTIYAKYRAYAVRPKIWFILHEKKIVIEEIIIDTNKIKETWSQTLRNEGFQLNPCIKSLLLKPEGKKVMDFQSFKNGYLK